MQSIEQRYYRETEEHNYNGCKLLVKKDDMLDSLDGRELLHHGRRAGEEEMTEIRVVSGQTNLILQIETSVVVAENNSDEKPKC